MAKPVSEREEAGVRLLTLEISEDELEVLIACLDYVLEKNSDDELENVCGARRDEIEGTRDDLSQLIDVYEAASFMKGSP